MRGKWYYFLAMLLIAGSWVGNIWYDQANRLERTVFLEHYIEVIPEAGDYFDLYYLEDKRLERKLIDIYIEGYPGLQVSPYPNYAEYRKQSLGKMIVSFDSADSGQEPPEIKEPAVIRQVTALYSDGSSEKVRIGEIHLVPRDNVNRDHDPIQWTSGAGSSDHSGYDRLAVRRPVNLTGLSSVYMSMVEEGDLLVHADIAKRTPGISHRSEAPSEAEIKLSGVPILDLPLPVRLNQGDSVKVAYKFNLSSPAKRMQVYQLRLRLEYADAEGDQAPWHSVDHIAYRPSPTEREIAEYVRERRGAL